MIEHELIFYLLTIILYDVFSQELFQTNFFADNSVDILINLFEISSKWQLVRNY